MVLQQRPTRAPCLLSAGFSKGTQCDQAKWLIPKCAFPALDPSPLLFKTIQQTAVDYTLHSKPWAEHLVKERNSTDTAHAPKELMTSWGNTESSIHHAFIQLTFIEHLLCISCWWTWWGFRNEWDTAELGPKANLIPGRHCAVWLGQRRGMCTWSFKRRGWFTRNDMKRVTSTTNNYTSNSNTK